MVELGHGHPRQRRLRRLVRSHLGIGSQPGEGRQLAVGQCSEQVDDSGAIRGIIGERLARSRRPLGTSSLALGYIGQGILLFQVVHERKQ